MENSTEIVPLKIVSKTEEPTQKLKVVDENEKDEKKYLKEQAQKGVIDLEIKNQEIENSQDPKDKEKLVEEVSKIENLIDKLKAGLNGLGLDQENILAIYQDLTKDDVSAEVEIEGAEEFIERLIKGDSVGAKKEAEKRGFNPAQLAVMVACFLFLVFGAIRQSEGSASDLAKSIEFSQEVEKSDLDKFLERLKIVRVFQKQEFLDMKIPAKPKGRENQKWEIQLLNQDRSTVGRFEVEDSLTYAAFGRNKEEKAEKAILVIRENGDIIETKNINIPN